MSTKRGKQSVEKNCGESVSNRQLNCIVQARSSLLSSFTCTLSLISNSTCFIGLLLEANCSDFGSGKRKSCGAWVSSGDCQSVNIASLHQKIKKPNFSQSGNLALQIWYHAQGTTHIIGMTRKLKKINNGRATQLQNTL